MIGWGVLGIVLGIASYIYFSWAEQEGGTFRSHVLIVLVYSIFGKSGVFFLLTGCGFFSILVGTIRLISSTSSRPRPGERRSGMGCWVWAVAGCVVLVVGLIVLWPGIKAAREAARRSQEKNGQRQSQQDERKEKSARQIEEEKDTRQPKHAAETGRVLSGRVGGTGGGKFQTIDRDGRPMSGVSIRVSNWGGKAAFRSIEPLFGPPDNPPAEHIVEFARVGYVVGGLHIRADEYVRAVRLVYVRPDGERLDMTDSYTGEWYGDQQIGELHEFVSTGQHVLGVYAQSGLVVDSLGVVFRSAE